MSRPFFNFRISELEAELAGRKGDFEFLRDLVYELGFRSTDKASKLKTEALQALAELQNSSSHTKLVGSPAPQTDTLLRREVSASPSPRQESVEVPTRRIPTPPMTNAPSSILDAWTALEVLSPPTFRRPEDLAGATAKRLLGLTGSTCPGQEPVKKPVGTRGSTIKSCSAR
jgi:hypothetical protein